VAGSAPAAGIKVEFYYHLVSLGELLVLKHTLTGSAPVCCIQGHSYLVTGSAPVY
jgi:hypothetical protein